MDVLMPQLGETVAEGKITKWFKSAGDAVKPGDNLFEIETDKVSMEVPSTTTGVLAEIRVAGGRGRAGRRRGGGDRGRRGAAQSQPQRPRRSAAPGSRPQSRLHRAAAATAAAPVARNPTTSRTPIKLDPFFEVRTPERNFGPARLAGGVAVTPLARRLAAEAGIDLSRVQRLRPARPHRRARRRRPRRGRRAHRSRPRRRSERRSGQGALRARQLTRKCRSTACAAPSRRG